VEQALVQTKRFPVPHMGIKRQKAFVECIDKLFEIKRKTNDLPVSDRLDFFVKNSNLIEKKDSEKSFEHAFAFLLEKAASHGTNMDTFLSSAALSSDGDIYDSRVEKVTLTTMHSAKGLEFSVVFISGCEDGLIPFRSERLLRMKMKNEDFFMWH
jgi:DNA helicase-2/ATP-dependent DNA helicase PcrA